MRRSCTTASPLVVFLLLPAPTVELQIPQRFENLQVLPPDIPRHELVEAMKGFTKALGVRCQHCHVGEGDDLSTFDFAADRKPEKRAARVMIEMVRAINRDHLPRLEEAAGEEAAGEEAPARVICATCHRGQPEPRVDEEPAPDAPRPAAAPPKPEPPPG